MMKKQLDNCYVCILVAPKLKVKRTAVRNNWIKIPIVNWKCNFFDLSIFLCITSVWMQLIRWAEPSKTITIQCINIIDLRVQLFNFYWSYRRVNCMILKKIQKKIYDENKNASNSRIDSFMTLCDNGATVMKMFALVSIILNLINYIYCYCLPFTDIECRFGTDTDRQYLNSYAWFRLYWRMAKRIIRDNKKTGCYVLSALIYSIVCERVCVHNDCKIP